MVYLIKFTAWVVVLEVGEAGVIHGLDPDTDALAGWARVLGDGGLAARSEVELADDLLDITDCAGV